MGQENDRRTAGVRAHIDERGRLTIKQDDRKAIGIDGKKALLEMDVAVLDVNPEDGDGDE